MAEVGKKRRKSLKKLKVEWKDRR